ncbi:MAG: ATP-dependent metallopeptidase FtsH/Yme1/Tma family protein [Firmicutes bacterium]|nr:ATP-dependent metallopeptidase FtsH/Yme1/Tma family protein [Bacillota bacterium]
MNRAFRTLAVYVVILFLTIVAVNYFSQHAPVQEITYNQFLQYAKDGQISDVEIVTSKGETSGRLKSGQSFRVVLPDDPALYAMLQEKGVIIKFRLPQDPPWWMALITTILPVLLIAGVFFLLMQQTQGTGSRVMQFGRSRARLVSEDKKKVTFADLGGVDEVKEELKEIVDFLRHPKRYLEMGARIPKGVLLVGPPGTGKTHVARAVAGEAGVPFFFISGSDFVEMFVGVGASRVRDLFEQAKKHAPAIVFIDEIDAVGRQRGAGYGGGHDEREQTLNQLLVEMDGFSTNEGIIVMAATNRPDVLDPALLRPGRFDRQVVIDRPDLKGRLEILRIHTRNKPLDKEVDLEVVARRTPGFTGADLENVVNEAALLAARQRRRKITMEDLEDAIDRVVAGPEKKSRVMSEKERRVIAYHEGAHALVAKLLPGTDPVHKASIIPRGAALGYVLQLPTEDRYIMTKAELMDRITSALAGRAAEELVFDEVSTGAAHDLETVTKLVRRMITEYGMSETLGPLTFGTKEELVFLGRDIARERNYSEEVAAAIDKEVRTIVNACYSRAMQLLRDHRDTLDRVASALLERETLEGPELDALLAGLPVPSKQPVPGTPPAGEQEGKEKRAPAPAPEVIPAPARPAPAQEI